MKSEFYCKIMEEKVVRETDHTATLDSGKMIQNSDLSISYSQRSPDQEKLQSPRLYKVSVPKTTNWR